MANFYYPYVGSKRRELKNILPLIDINKYDTFIEPFGGSCCISRALYALDKNKKYIVSDIDKEVVTFCNTFYNDDDQIIKKALKTISQLDNKEKYNIFINEYRNKKEKGDIPKPYETLIYNSYYSLRVGLYPTTKTAPTYKNLIKNKDTINEFFKNVKYRYADYKKYMERYKYNHNALVILDPPYINSTKSNGFYESPNIDWEWLKAYFKTCECKFIMIVEDNIFMRILYKKWLKVTYSKKYEMTKRTTVHQLYSNIEGIENTTI